MASTSTRRQSRRRLWSMSIHTIVFVPDRPSLPASTAWTRAAKQHGFALTFPDPVDVLRHTGSVPVECDGIEAAFELYCDRLDDYLEEVGDDLSQSDRQRVSGFRYAVDFCTHSRIDDRMAAVIAAATLAASTSGLLLDSGGTFVEAAGAIAWAREQLSHLSPANRIDRRAVESSVHAFVDQIVAEHGYVPIAALPPMNRRGDRWHARAGKRFKHELVVASVYFDGDESFLAITFFGTRHAPDKLRAKGVAGKVSGRNLSDYLYIEREETGNRGKKPLPKNIPAGELNASIAIGKQLRKEFAQADAAVWGTL